MKTKSFWSIALVAGGALLTTACGGDAPPESEEPTLAMVEGECADVYGADICTWAEVEGDQVVSLGMTVPMASVEGAPADAEMVWPPFKAANIALPAAAREQLGVHDLQVYWEAHGHPPGPYLVPHFDFHFYTIDEAATDAIDCADETKPTSPPDGYALPDVEIPEIGFLPGLCVPAMGMHALLQSELESEDTFSGTMVIGYYEQDPIFYEPMITQELLMQRQTFSLDMPSVSGLSEGVTIPGHFEAQYDADSDSYRFVFSEVGGG
jgi:hypothetical protein